MIAEKGHVTFAQLKSRLMNLLINALQVETDPQNTHMLLGKSEANHNETFVIRCSFLGALLLSVQDSAAAEEVEQVTQPDTVVHDSTANLLSSGLSSFVIQLTLASRIYKYRMRCFKSFRINCRLYLNLRSNL